MLPITDCPDNIFTMLYNLVREITDSPVPYNPERHLALLVFISSDFKKTYGYLVHVNKEYELLYGIISHLKRAYTHALVNEWTEYDHHFTMALIHIENLNDIVKQFAS